MSCLLKPCHCQNIYSQFYVVIVILLYFGYSPGIVAASAVSGDWTDIEFVIFFPCTIDHTAHLSVWSITGGYLLMYLVYFPS